MTYSNRRGRRGILLLVVLSLLVLFVLLLLSFLNVTRRYRAATVSIRKHELRGTSPRRLLHGALLDLLRDTQNLRSSLIRASLLADKYGQPARRVTVLNIYTGRDAIRFDASGLGDLSIDTNDLDALDIVASDSQMPLGLLPDSLAGRELSVAGDPQTTTTRIVRYLPNVTGADGTPVDRMYVIPWSLDGKARPSRGDTLLINDPPFDGTGAGFNGTNALDKSFSVGAFGSQPVAYLINHRELLNHLAPNIGVLDTLLDLGGQDESWDAADYQNAFLSCTISRGAEAVTILPSFHRPDLVNYYVDKFSLNLHRELKEFSDAEKQSLRSIVLRPLRLDHPKFTGGNPLANLPAASGGFPALGIDPINGPWDVDNDGDGQSDSVWVDLGHPVERSEDGRPYKPLFAFFVRDLDGKVNVNTAGNLAHSNADYFEQPGHADYPLPKPRSVNGEIIQSRGEGYGPAEIHLGSVLPATSTWDPVDTIVAARYRGLGSSAETRPGFPNIRDFPDVLDAPGLDDVASVPAGFGVNSDYASPSDVYGRNAIFVASNLVQPQYVQPSFVGSTLSEIIDDPYEIDILKSNRFDHFFSTSDLEALLRHNDHDAPLIGTRTSRLTSTANRPILSIPRVDHLLTTRSFEVPCPPRASQVNDTFQTIPPLPFAELYERRLSLRGLSPDRIAAAMSLMLPWELHHGETMNVNRPWGNGRDDDPVGTPGHGVVDDPDEFGNSDRMYVEYEVPYHLDGEESAPDDIRLPGYYDNGSGEDPRVVFARHLYCLAMFLKDSQFAFPIAPEQPGLSLTDQKNLTARRFAQWAVNVVDFRDADNIMTAFEYDLDPYDGWDVDGNVATPDATGALVWGCELPRLLVTECLAFHDRRVRDLPMYGLRSADANGDDLPDDDDLDQDLIPQGSLYVELFCPPSAGQDYACPDLFTDGKLDLGKMCGDGQNPVWRIAISRPIQDLRGIGSGYLDALQRIDRRPNTASFQPNVNLEIERVIWFCRNSPVGTDELSVNTFYNQCSVDPLVSPGEHVVVAPRVVTYVGEKSLPSGNSALSDQAIGISLGSNPPFIAFRNLQGQIVDPKPILPIIAAADPPSHWANNVPIGVNVSEPIIGPEYYPEPDDHNPATGLRERYVVPIDRPLDSQTLADDRPGESTKRLADYTANESGILPHPTMVRTGNYRYIDGSGDSTRIRTAYLQRLANPFRPWNAVTNPYITVDMTPVDLTVFNGASRSKRFAIGGSEFELDPDDPYMMVPHPFAASCQRVDLSSTNRLWPYEFLLSEQQPESMDVTADEVFQFDLLHSLGSHSTVSTTFFPWIRWGNRPFVSELELLLVPSSAPDRLLMEFDLQSSVNPYERYSWTAFMESVKAAPFGHLLNFFQGNGKPGGANLHRILDFLDVPSRYIGLNHNFLFSTDGMQHGFDEFWAPHNHLSKRREPGKINLNTIFDGRVWNALTTASPQHFQRELSTPGFYDQFVLSRQGFSVPKISPVAPYQFDANYPTVFANPFRSGTAVGLQPPAAGQTGVVGTLLRQADDRPGIPLLGPMSQSHVQDFARHSSFLYEGVQRLANMSSTQSNVYAVWITVGYFEVEPWTNGVVGGPAVFDDAHPDGLTLGPELGEATGGIRRHRAFYIVDRSIPVAYEPGQDHNVENALLLERMID